MMSRPIKPGTLVVVTGIDPNRIMRIARVVEDRGKTVLVQTDDEIEGDAAVEYDFDTPESKEMEVDPARLRQVVE